MTFARRLAHIENIPQQDSAERAFNKLLRTYTAQMEALKRYRTGGEQKVTVQHVTVGEGGQAIVGNVTQAPRKVASPLWRSQMRKMHPCQASTPKNPRFAFHCLASRKRMNGQSRNTRPMLSSPRCGAKTRSGKPCRSPAVGGKTRCRMHGGALGSGAPRGNQNALKHGLYTREAMAQRRQLRDLMRQSRSLLLKIKWE